MRDELILALDLYFRHSDARGRGDHPEVVALSDLLNQLPIHPVADREADFRNPNGVAMKLGNFQALDREGATVFVTGQSDAAAPRRSACEVCGFDFEDDARHRGRSRPLVAALWCAAVG